MTQRREDAKGNESRHRMENWGARCLPSPFPLRDFAPLRLGVPFLFPTPKSRCQPETLCRVNEFRARQTGHSWIERSLLPLGLDRGIAEASFPEFPMAQFHPLLSEVAFDGVIEMDPGE